MGIDELYQWAEDNKRRVHHWFFSTDLTFYIKGGRISKTAGAVGTLLGICPLLNVSCDGRLIRYDPLAFSIGCHVGPGAFGMAISKRVPAMSRE